MVEALRNHCIIKPEIAGECRRYPMQIMRRKWPHNTPSHLGLNAWHIDSGPVTIISRKPASSTCDVTR
jgi:hypothetical protein